MLYRNTYRVETARHPGWDYANASFYFVTICTHNRHPYFGEIAESSPLFTASPAGHVAQRIWQQIPQQFPNARLDEFVVMPNHVHGIIQIVVDSRDAIYRVSENDRVSEKHVSPGGITGNKNPMIGQHSISSIVRWYKGRVSFEARQLPHEIPFAWQTRFHDRIIRSEDELNRIRQYIKDNPLNWSTDDLNAPERRGESETRL
jgi:putative transposase